MPTAFDVLVDRHARALLAYALRRVEAPEDAADVVSETLLVAWRRIDDVPGGDETRPWLFGVARRVLSNWRRSHNRSNRLGAKLREQLTELTSPDHADGVGSALVIRSAIARLDDDDRELLRLTAWEGLPPAHIAIAMSMPAATVRSRLHRARNRLRAELDAAGWSEERKPSSGHVSDGECVLAQNAEGES